MGHGVRQCLPALRLQGVARRERRTRVMAALGMVGLARLRAGLSARAVGRHEDARLDRPGAGDPAAAAADGRAVRRARRDHAHPARTTICCSCGEPRAWTVVFVTHSVFESVYLSQPDGGDGGAARAGCRPTCDRRPYPRDDSFRTSPAYNSLCREASAALHRAMGALMHGRDPQTGAPPRAESQAAGRATFERWFRCWRR